MHDRLSENILKYPLDKLLPLLGLETWPTTESDVDISIINEIIIVHLMRKKNLRFDSNTIKYIN